LKAHPLGAGRFKFVSQEAGVQMVFEVWEEYWRRPPGVKTIVVKAIRDLAARMDGLQTGELDLAYSMKVKLSARVMADPLTDLGSIGIRGKLQVMEGRAFRAKIAHGRKGYPGNRTIVQNIDVRPGGAKATIGVYAVCNSPASFVCEPQIEELWSRHQASIDLNEWDQLIKAIQRILIEEYYFVPIYLNPFVHAVGARVFPAGDGFHR
jgi:ABC-type transport system substrate-binding protein